MLLNAYHLSARLYDSFAQLPASKSPWRTTNEHDCVVRHQKRAIPCDTRKLLFDFLLFCTCRPDITAKRSVFAWQTGCPLDASRSAATALKDCNEWQGSKLARWQGCRVQSIQNTIQYTPTGVDKINSVDTSVATGRSTRTNSLSKLYTYWILLKFNFCTLFSSRDRYYTNCKTITEIFHQAHTKL